MKFSNFLFPESRDPARDGQVIDETLREARLTDELGFEVIWLAEHHFDGICAYVDPVSFAAALAVATQRTKIGFAVAQMSLHHPIRMAEQLALIDNISKGGLIVGLGRGTAYNIYDYQGYGLDHNEAQARFEEAEAIMFEAWRGEKFEHHGEFWDLKLPMLRPRPYTQAASLCDPLRLQRGGHAAYRATGPAIHDERAVQCGDAASHGPVSAYVARAGHGRGRDRSETSSSAGCGGMSSSPRPTRRLNASPCRPSRRCTRSVRRCASASIEEQGVSIVPMPAPGAAPPARTVVEHSLIYGSPATVAEKLAQVAAIGIGGVIMQFRLGPMCYDDTARA